MSLSPSSSAADIIAHLKSLRSEANIEGMARFGIVTGDALGISNRDLRSIARLVKRDHARALGLWESGIREAQLLSAFTDEPAKFSADLARSHAAGFRSWEMVDCWVEVLGNAGLAPLLIPEFAADPREFVRRTAFSLLAWTAVHRKQQPADEILAYLPLIEMHATDDRNFVRKAVNWSLRQIGKRDADCRGPCLALAEKLAASSNRTSRWIGKDALRELSAAMAKGKAS